MQVDSTHGKKPPLSALRRAADLAIVNEKSLKSKDPTIARRGEAVLVRKS